MKTRNVKCRERGDATREWRVFRKRRGGGGGVEKYQSAEISFRCSRKWTRFTFLSPLPSLLPSFRFSFCDRCVVDARIRTVQGARVRTERGKQMSFRTLTCMTVPGRYPTRSIGIINCWRPRSRRALHTGNNDRRSFERQWPTGEEREGGTDGTIRNGEKGAACPPRRFERLV